MGYQSKHSIVPYQIQSWIKIVREIQSHFPTCGNRQMIGHLLARGYRVQQIRVREAQRRVDPQGAIVRRLHALNRRHYFVPAPRSLYHVDGNHKLIRYYVDHT